MDLPAEEARAVIEQLDSLLDPLSLRAWIVKQTKAGRKAHPSDPWGFTRRFVLDYGTEADAQRVIDLFEAAGIGNDLEAGRFLLKWDEYVP